MATGQFRLFYKDGLDAEYPGTGVAYQIVTAFGTVWAQGFTDAQGLTKRFDNTLSDADSFHLQVLDADKGGYCTPDTASGSINDPAIKLKGRDDTAVIVKPIRVLPYFKLRFTTHPALRGVAGAKFTGYALDANGREAIGRSLDNAGAVTGITDGRGYTPRIRCANNLVFKFELPGTAVKVSSRRLRPLLQGQPQHEYDVPSKTVRALTAPQPDHRAHLAGKTNAPIIISPADQELLMVPQADFDDFEEVSGRLEQVMAAAHLAKLDLSRALEGQSAESIAEAEKALGVAQDRVKTELNKNFKKVADLKEVLTLESYNKGKDSATGASRMGLRRRYLKADKYLQLKDKRRNKTEYKLAVKFAAVDTKSAAEVKPKTLDVQALKDSFKKIATKTSKEWNSDPHVLDLLDLAAHDYADNLIKSDTYQVDEQAQWMRLVGCAGASAEIDWGKKSAQLKGNLQGKAVLLEGKIEGQWAVPSLKGWLMSFAGEDLGALRFVVKCDLYGFAGAKVVASGAVGIALHGDKQQAVAVKKDDKDKLSTQLDRKKLLPRFEPTGAYESVPKEMNGVDLGIDAFAGIEGGITPGGMIQWLPPEEKDFVSFAEVSANVAANLGAGVSGQLTIYFREGKFRVKAAARLCWGVGCKGALEFAVNADKLLEFARWVFNQLLNGGFRRLVYFDEVAFGQLSKLMLMCVADGSPTHQMLEQWSANIDLQFKRTLDELDLAKSRQSVVDNINRNPDWLTYATPEARGMLLYQIIHHSPATHMRDTPGFGGSVLHPELHYMPHHKQAILNIMATAASISGWENTLQHISPHGTKSAQDPGKNEGDVLRYLNDGKFLADLPSVVNQLNQNLPVQNTGNEYLNKYLEMRAKRMVKFPKGYKIARLDDPRYDLLVPFDGREHIRFAMIDTHGIGEAWAGDPGSLMA